MSNNAGGLVCIAIAIAVALLLQRRRGGEGELFYFIIVTEMMAASLWFMFAVPASTNQSSNNS